MQNPIILETFEEPEKKAHPWRRCTMGKHLVREYEAHIAPSKEHPDGTVARWHEHCADNPSRKDELSFDEIQYISKTYFASLSGPPTAGVLTKEFDDADKYDNEIRGWTQYWNDIFLPEDKLNPNLVKAIIATESSFRENPKEMKSAHGLMQIQDGTLHYLSDTKGELRNYLIRLNLSELLNPSANICAGIRWLFRKKETASATLKRPASWYEAIEDYKGLLDKILHHKEYDHRIMEHLDKYYKLLESKS